MCKLMVEEDAEAGIGFIVKIEQLAGITYRRKEGVSSVLLRVTANLMKGGKYLVRTYQSKCYSL